MKRDMVTKNKLNMSTYLAKYDGEQSVNKMFQKQNKTLR